MEAGKLVPGILIAIMVASIALLANAAITTANTTATTVPEAELIEEVEITRLSVTGYGALSFKPDQATVSFGILGQGATASEALAECSAKAGAVISALKELGIGEEDMKTTGIYVNPQYDWEAKPPKIVGYEASYTLRVLVRDLGLIGKAIDSAIAAGADNMWGVQFGLSEDKLKELQGEVIKLAIEDARAKAEAAAEALGMQITGVSSVNLSPSYVPRPTVLKEAAGAAAPPIMPGEEQLTATVSITYILQ